MARRWVEQGPHTCTSSISTAPAQGRPVNGDSVRRHRRRRPASRASSAAACAREAHIAEALGWGVARVILGTRALQDPAWCAAMCRRFPGKIVARHRRPRRPRRHRGLAARRRIARPWTWPAQCAAWPLAAIIYTDISRDGMLEGPNVEATAELAASRGRAGHRLRRRHHAGRRAPGWPGPGCPAASSAGRCTRAGSTCATAIALAKKEDADRQRVQQISARHPRARREDSVPRTPILSSTLLDRA